MKTFPYFKKSNKKFKWKKFHVFHGVGINTEEVVLRISETTVDIQGRELLITTEKKEKFCNENEAAKLKIIDTCEASNGNEVVIIENSNFETVSDFSVVGKNSSIVKYKKIHIVEQSQSSCSFSITTSIDDSVDDASMPDLFNVGCNKSYNAEDKVSNGKFEKQTGSIGVMMKIVM